MSETNGGGPQGAEDANHGEPRKQGGRDEETDSGRV